MYLKPRCTTGHVNDVSAAGVCDLLLKSLVWGCKFNSHDVLESSSVLCGEAPVAPPHGLEEVGVCNGDC